MNEHSLCWKDAPDTPGLWYVPKLFAVLRYSSYECEHNSGYQSGRCYGPVPDDSESDVK